MTYTGVRLSKENVERAQALARQLGVSRNRLLEMLIENAQVESQPSIVVSLGQNKNGAVSARNQSTVFVSSNP